MVPIRRRNHQAFPDILLKRIEIGRLEWPITNHLRMQKDKRTDRELLAEEDFRLAHERIFFDVDTRASAFILFAMGTLLFPTTSGDKMNVVLAGFVQNDDRIREYTWCEAVVAYL
ncbi:unnamed protein product [Victoria cruziana]